MKMTGIGAIGAHRQILRRKGEQKLLRYRVQVLILRYNLGPNGGILTALNLFTTKFDQVLGYVEKRAESVE